MPVTDGTVNLYLQLGIAGATLLILLIFVILLFRLIGSINKNESVSQSTRIDKLCDKIDSLITSYSENTQKLNEVLLCNDKDQKNTLELLDRILSAILDVSRRVVRIDDRTYMCLGNEKHIKEEVGNVK